MSTDTRESLLEITTNGRARDLVSLSELPLKNQLDFSYIPSGEEHQPRLVLYLGDWHDVFDTQRIDVGDVHSHPCGWALYVPKDSPLAKWDSIHSSTYFSGLLFRLTGEDQVVVGQYFSRG